MTSRKEDELDLIAMQIADEIKRSDNLKLVSPRNWPLALAWLSDMKRNAETRQDGAA